MDDVLVHPTLYCDATSLNLFRKSIVVWMLFGCCFSSCTLIKFRYDYKVTIMSDISKGTEVDVCVASGAGERTSEETLVSIITDSTKNGSTEPIKKAVVTAAFLIEKSKCDSIGKLERIDGWDYIMFTNDSSKVVAPGWDIRQIDPPFSKGVYCAKYVKWMTHLYLPEYDIIMWIDGFAMPNPRKKDALDSIAIKLAGDPYSLPIILRKHPYLTTVESELNECIRLKKIDETMKTTVLSHFKDTGYDVSTKSLYWTEYIIKNNRSTIMREFSTEMFSLLMNLCYRDQVCFPYMLWKFGVELPADKHIVNDLSTWNGAKINHEYI